jgi:fimbrial isopeptide formation D2 family protein
MAATPPSLPDPSQDVSLTITKYDADGLAGTAASGGDQSSAVTGGTALSGVGFTLYQVTGIDLTATAGWQAEASLTDYINAQSPRPSTVTDLSTAVDDWATANINSASLDVVGSEKTTDTSGVVTWASGTLTQGLYLVDESTPKTGYAKLAPFFVSLPMTDAVNLDKWIYDVHVYPKNSLVGIDKTVADAQPGGFKPGDSVVWTISGDIPAPTTGTPKSYVIADPLDSALTFDDTSTNTKVFVGAWDATNSVWTPDAAIQLTKNTDYTLTPVQATSADPTNVTVEFLAPGLAKLNATATYDPANKVVVQLDTTVNAAAEITNVAWLFINSRNPSIAADWPSLDDTEKTDDGGDPSDPTLSTKWGQITILKTDDTAAKAPLQGAEFRIYTTLSDAQSATALGVFDPNAVVWPDASGKYDTASTSGVTDAHQNLTTNATGLVQIPDPGLRYSDWANGVNVAPSDPDFQYYWLVEVKAPTGYQLQTAPIKFTVTDTSTTITGSDATFQAVDDSKDSADTDVTVVDVLANAGFPLPFTGGVGVTIVYLVGFAAIAGAIVLGIVVKPRRRQDAKA